MGQQKRGTFLGLLAPAGNGNRVQVFDRITRSRHDGVTPEVIRWALGLIAPAGDTIEVQVEFGYEIGKSDRKRVLADPQSVMPRTIYAEREALRSSKPFRQRRHDARELIRWVIGEPQTSSLLSLILHRPQGEDAYILLTAYIGTLSEPQPWDRAAQSRRQDRGAAWLASTEFWSDYAILFGTESLRCYNCARIIAKPTMDDIIYQVVLCPLCMAELETVHNGLSHVPCIMIDVPCWGPPDDFEPPVYWQPTKFAVPYWTREVMPRRYLLPDDHTRRLHHT